MTLYDVWLTMDDDRVCPQCAELQSQRWPAGSSHPQPPAHFGCRCMLMQELIEEPMPEPLPFPMPPYPIPEPDRPPRHDLRAGADPEETEAKPPAPQRIITPVHFGLAASSGPRRYAVTLIAAGPLTGHRVTLPQEILTRDWPIFAKGNLTAFADHPDFLGSPRIDRILGTYRNVQLAGERLTAELELAPTPIAAALQPLLDLAARDPTHAPDVGLSANVWATLDEPEDPRAQRSITRLTEAESVDVVFRPASAPARITQILAAKGPHPMDELTLTPVAEQAPPNPDEYLTRLAGATLTMALREANLPAASETAIREQFAGQTPSATQIDAAITQQRQLIAALSFQITGHDHPLDNGRITGMTTNLDEAAKVINWMFGVSGAPMPPPSLRRPADIYGAITGDYEWHGVFTPAKLLFASANSTTLADLAVNAMNKIVVEQWDGLSEYRWFEDLVTVQPHDGSTHDMAWINVGGIANLPVVAEGAAYTELSLADSKESDSFIKYGAYVGVTQEMLRKSELAKIQAIPRALAVAAVRTRSAAIAGLFTANSGVGPTLDDDSTALFHSNHGSNVQTTALGTDLTAWKAARLECYKQTEAGSSKRLAFWPRYCLVPGDLYDTALILFSYGSGPGGYPGTANNDVNPYAVARANDARPIPIAVPDWTDANDWAYLVDPRQHPVIQMSYVQAPGGGSHPAPEIYSVSTPTAGLTFSNDVLPIKCRDWFSYGVSTWRGIGKRNVA
jgi:hypothetical protein